MLNIIEILKVILIGIVEGVTEWLPVSSTGHMIILNELIKLNVSEEFWEMFEVVIQLGAIMAVVVIYWWKIWPFYMKGKNGKGTIVKAAKDPAVKNIALSMDAFWMWVKIVVACVPAVVYGLILDDKVSELYQKTIPGLGMRVEVVVVAVMLILIGAMFIIVEKNNSKKKPVITSIAELDYKTVLIIGAWQLLAAAFPGTSRSGATIIGAILIGVSRTVATEFTFFLGIPVMFGASLLKILKFGFDFSGEELVILLLGMVIAFVVSIVAIKFLLGYIKKNDFKAFGVYRIILGFVVLIAFGLVL